MIIGVPTSNILFVKIQIGITGQFLTKHAPVGQDHSLALVNDRRKKQMRRRWQVAQTQPLPNV